MGIAKTLSALTLKPLVSSLCSSLGVTGVDAAISALGNHFTTHGERLSSALARSMDKAWSALEISLAGDTLWQRCKVALASADNQAFRQQIRCYLDAVLSKTGDDTDDFRQECLVELREARKKKLLVGEMGEPAAFAKEAAVFAGYENPQTLIQREEAMIKAIARELENIGYDSLPKLLVMSAQGVPLLIVAARYFLRREIETDSQLFQGLTWSKLDQLDEAQGRGFDAIHQALTAQQARFEELLQDVEETVLQTHSAVLDLKVQMEGQDEQLRGIGTAVQKLLEQHHLQNREVQPKDSLSVRNEGERELVKQLVRRYRSLPESDRNQVPALLNAIGKLQMVAGDYDAAQKDFQAVAEMTKDNHARAEAHMNAYHAALEQRNWDAALKELIATAKLDPRRYSPFPMGKYQPVRILGAGGFGVAFLCKHRHMNAQDVVKTLMLDELGRDADQVFAEAQVLRQLDHPAIIRISTCGYVDPEAKKRPYLVMDYFEGQTLDEYVKKNGPLSVEELLPIVRLTAEGLAASHAKNILHRDVKPANLLVREEKAGWRVKVIDFGLAMRKKVAQTSQNTGTAHRSNTRIGNSIAGTLDFGSPEQMGRRDEPVSFASDIYGLGKTCCYALFQTTQPLPKHWKSIPVKLANILERCLEEDPQNRPENCEELLADLSRLDSSAPTRSQARSREVDEDYEREPPPRKRRSQTNKQLVYGLGGVVLVLVCVVTGLLASRGSKSDSTKQAQVEAPPEKKSPDRYVPSPGPINKGNPTPKNNNKGNTTGKDNEKTVPVQDPPKIPMSMTDPTEVIPEQPPLAPIFGRAPLVYVADLPEFGVRNGEWPFTKDGTTGSSKKDPIYVNRIASPKGLGMHPPSSPGSASAKYRLGKQAAVFKATVAVNDTATFCWTPAIFTVWGDGKKLFESNNIAHNHFRTQECSVDVRGVDVLELRVHCVGRSSGTHAVWVEPRLLERADTSDVVVGPVVNKLFEKGPRHFLSELKETEVKAGAWPLGKNGDTGNPDNFEPIVVNGQKSPKGLGLHPPARGFAAVSYRLDKKAALFKAAVAFNDNTVALSGPAVFEVYGDDKRLWQSNIVNKRGISQPLSVNVAGVNVLELRVVATGIINHGLNAVWIEPRLLEKSNTPDVAANSGLFASAPQVYLADLPEFEVKNGASPFTKDGTSGSNKDSIKVSGKLSPKGLGMHPPPSPGSASVKYRLGKQAAVFKATVGINDTSNFCFTPTIFTVHGDGKQLFESKWIAAQNPRSQECSVDVTGVDVLELRVHCVGHNSGSHAVLVEPRLLERADAVDPTAAKVVQLFERGPRHFLSDLPETVDKSGPWPISKNGELGDGVHSITVKGQKSPKGLGMHPPNQGAAIVRYRLDKKVAAFKGEVAIDDNSKGMVLGSGVFEVYGDGNRLWQSATVNSQQLGPLGFNIDVTGVTELELRVVSAGNSLGVHAVWIEPRLLEKSNTPDK